MCSSSQSEVIDSGSRTALFGGAFLNNNPGNFLLFANPAEILELRSCEALGAFFENIEERLAEGYSLAGYIGYEAGYGFEPHSFGSCRATDKSLPLACFGVYDAPRLLTKEQSEELLSEEYSSSQPIFDLSHEQHAEIIRQIKAHIAAGNVYQVNLTGRYHVDVRGRAPGLFRRLLGKQPVAYSAWLDIGDHQVLSWSPELFFRIGDNGSIETRPMKGTAPRGGNAEEDNANREWLRTSEKNRAENLMIVDLLRNDLGRICTPGSVQTAELFRIETYPTLHQMVSSVTGTLRENCSTYEIFRALFPCGSVTGAPKIRAMQLIQELERSPRGVYTGAIGYMLPDSSMCFNVAIRTLVLHGGKGVYGAGGGIVWDSESEGEYRECLLKAKILDSVQDEDFALFETILYNGSYVWLEEHLLRLGRSAACLGFSCDGERIRRELAQLAEHELAQSGRSKVRLELQRDGRFSISAEQLPSQQSPDPVRVCRASVSVMSTDYFRMHKTTRREPYDQLFNKAKAKGFDEILFCNERGEVTEGAISNIIVRKNGRYLTPPLASGLLNGVYRQYFLATRSAAEERILTMEDVENAEQFFLCNSVRGLRRAVLCEDVL